MRKGEESIEDRKIEKEKIAKKEKKKSNYHLICAIIKTIERMEVEKNLRRKTNYYSTAGIEDTSG